MLFDYLITIIIIRNESQLLIKKPVGAACKDPEKTLQNYLRHFCSFPPWVQFNVRDTGKIFAC